MSMHVFPVQGGARYSDDWHAPRSEGRTHLGNDLFASEGTPLLAVEAGDVRFGTDPLGGNVANLKGLEDGTRYYYAHLSAFEGSNRRVLAGEIIGYLGKTGNAATTLPHVHFEVHPGGGEAVNPFPLIRKLPIQAKPEVPSPVASEAVKPSGVWVLGLLSALGYLIYRGHRR